MSGKRFWTLSLLLVLAVTGATAEQQILNSPHSETGYGEYPYHRFNHTVKRVAVIGAGTVQGKPRSANSRLTLARVQAPQVYKQPVHSWSPTSLSACSSVHQALAETGRTLMNCPCVNLTREYDFPMI